MPTDSLPQQHNPQHQPPAWPHELVDTRAHVCMPHPRSAPQAATPIVTRHPLHITKHKFAQQLRTGQLALPVLDPDGPRLSHPDRPIVVHGRSSKHRTWIALVRRSRCGRIVVR